MEESRKESRDKVYSTDGVIVKILVKLILELPNKLYNSFMSIRRSPVYNGSRPKINGRIYMVSDKGKISFGQNVKINSSMKSNPIGGNERTILFAEHGAEIVIGNNVGISNTVIHAAQRIVIEDNVLIGGDCRIYDTDFHAIEFNDRIENKNTLVKPIIVKSGAFIGAHCIILKGVSIGKKSVIGAGSVVTKSVPDGEIWAGNPAKYIRKV